MFKPQPEFFTPIPCALVARILRSQPTLQGINGGKGWRLPEAGKPGQLLPDDAFTPYLRFAVNNFKDGATLCCHCSREMRSYDAKQVFPRKRLGHIFHSPGA